MVWTWGNEYEGRCHNSTTSSWCIKSSIWSYFDLFEGRRRILDHFQHGPLDSGLSNVRVIFSGAGHARWSSSGPLVARFIEVRLADQDQWLHRNQNLQQINIIIQTGALQWSGLLTMAIYFRTFNNLNTTFKIMFSILAGVRSSPIISMCLRNREPICGNTILWYIINIINNQKH